MDARHTTKFLSTLSLPIRLHRPFSTHSPLLLASPLPPSRPPPHTPPQPQPQTPSAPRPTRRNEESFKLASNLSSESARRNALTRVKQYDDKQRAITELEASGRARDLEKKVLRRWKSGDVYAPHDLSSVEMRKWNVWRPGRRDVFDMLGIDPKGEWKNFSIMSEYMTKMGRIRHRKDTGLRAVNQRKIAKAIRRAVGMGLMPSVHKHPEVLEIEAEQRNVRTWLRQAGSKSKTGVRARWVS